MPVFRTNTPQSIVKKHYSQRGPTGLTGAPGAGGASRTTLLEITQQSPSGTAFFVNSGSTHYTFSGETGNLGASALNYLSNEAVQIYLRGGKLLKKKHTEWITEYSFILYMPVDIGDYLEILS
jgi:hypothetical protein